MIVIILSAVLIPVGWHVLSLFSYPSPESNTFILPTCDLPFRDLNWWFPSPNAVNDMVLIPDTASFKFLWSLSVFSGYHVVPSLPNQVDIVVIPAGASVLT